MGSSIFPWTVEAKSSSSSFFFVRSLIDSSDFKEDPRTRKNDSNFLFPFNPTIEANRFSLLLIVHLFYLILFLSRCKRQRRLEEGRHGDLGSSIESNLGHERRAFCLSLNAARPSSFTRIRDSNARPGRVPFTIYRPSPTDSRVSNEFFGGSMSRGGRCGKMRGKNRFEGGIDRWKMVCRCERRLTRRLKMFAKWRETGAEEVERYLGVIRR